MSDERGPTLLDAIRDFSENASPLDFVLIAQHWEMFLTGIGYTLVLVAVSLVIGGALSLPLAVARAYRTPVVNQVIWAYVYLFRGTPLLVQLYIIYYGAGQFELVRESFLWPVLGAELVGAPGHRLKRQPGRPPGARDDGIAGAGAASGPDRHAFAAAHAPLGQRNVDRSPRSGRGAHHQRPVQLAHRARAEGRRQTRRRPGTARQQKRPAGVLVEAVHQARALARAEAQRIEHGVEMARDAAAALHRETGRLVDHQQLIVAIEDAAAQVARRLRIQRRRGRACGSRGRLAQRRHPNPLTGMQARAGANASAVDPDLAAAQQLLQAAVRQVREMPPEPAVEPDSGFVRGDRHRPRPHGPPSSGASAAARRARNARQRSRRWRISRSKPASPGRYSEGRSMPSGK